MNDFALVADWSAIAEGTVKAPPNPSPPPVAALDFAIVQLEIYDAVESIDRRYQPYHAVVPHFRTANSESISHLVERAGCLRQSNLDVDAGGFLEPRL